MSPRHPLDHWQARLVENFDAVTLRKLELPQQPVTFALEHGLSASALDALRKAINGCVVEHTLRVEHYLCWSVYAAEIGYLFSGDEYWQTFDELTPEWSFLDRPFIRVCLRRFADQYNGARPSGAWARHRSIIGWPITHAILPKDLQRQLAAVLFRIRHGVAMDDVESRRQLGQLIAAESNNVTSRFRQLIAEPDLIGQIGAALLLEDQSSNLIAAPTLNRISNDLISEEQSRTWLGGAQRYLRRRAHVTGMRSGRRASGQATTAIQRQPSPQLRPRLVLRCQKDDRWCLTLDVPNLTPLVRHYPDLMSVIGTSQVSVGSSSRGFMVRALLHGDKSVLQPKWPQTGVSLLQFSPSNTEFNALLANSCMLERGPWLFQLGSDGTARQILSRTVMADVQYIIVAEPRVLSHHPIGETITLDCVGTEARLFKLSSLDECKARLAELGCQPARSIRAQPIGLVPAFWDGEGSAEWLSTDHPIIGISSNFSIEQYDVQMDVGKELLSLTINPKESAEQVLVQLPQLAAGEYHLSIGARPSDPSYPAEQGEMEISIRDPAPGGEQAQRRVAMVVTQAPSDASFEDVFDETLRVRAFGPAARTVDCTVRMRRKQSIENLFETTVRDIALPMSEDDWARLVRRIVDNDKSFSDAYYEADSCELTLDGGELGAHSFTFDRPFVPLRWGMKQRSDGVAIELYSDIDNAHDVDVFRFAFSSPMTPNRVSADELKKAALGRGERGLYLAQTEGYQVAAIVPARSFQALSTIRPRFRWRVMTKELIDDLLDGIDIWGNVSTTADLYGRYAWTKSMKAMIQQLSGLMGGTPWYKADLAFHRTPRVELLGEWIPHGNYGANWVAPLRDSLTDIDVKDTDARVTHFAKVTHCRDELCRFALQLASNPTNMRQTYAVHFQSLLAEILRRPELFRAARFLVLAVDNQANSKTVTDNCLYRGWQWR